MVVLDFRWGLQLLMGTYTVVSTWLPEVIHMLDESVCQFILGGTDGDLMDGL